MSLGLLCLLRDAGRAAFDLAQDCRATLRVGDELVLVDDSGTGDSATWAARAGILSGWPEGVRLRRIVTATRGQGDTGIATNLALDAARSTRLILLPGAARLDPAGLAAARDQAEAEDLDLLAAPLWLADPVSARRSRLAPGEGAFPGGLILRRSLFETPRLRAAEGGTGSDFGLCQALSARARRQGQAQTPIATLPRPPDPDAALLAALQALIAARPETRDSTLAALALRLRGSSPGARAVLLSSLESLAQSLFPPFTGPLARLLTLLRDGDPAARHLLRDLTRPAAAVDTPPHRLAGPAVLGRARIRLCCEGPHARRTPFAYPALQALWDRRAELTETPQDADLILYAHPIDLLTLRPEVARAAAKPFVLISEEPFWDSLFSPDPLAATVLLRAAHLGEVRAHQVNHHRSAIFDFDRLPYFTLTDPAYADRYARLFARNARLSPDDWRQAFACRPLRAAFMAERRPEAFHDLALPGGDIVGLCAWRTRLAEAYAAPPGSGAVLRVGAGWQGEPGRLGIGDWHGDKIARLDGQAQILSAIENTHQPGYLSEKLFDAFACGGRPLYVASPGHRVHDLGLPAAAWINLWDRTSAEAAATIDAAPWDAGFTAAYAAAQTGLAGLWSDPGLLDAERRRLSQALHDELDRLLALGPL